MKDTLQTLNISCCNLFVLLLAFDYYEVMSYRCSQAFEHTSCHIEHLKTIQMIQKYVTYLANSCNNLNTLYLGVKLLPSYETPISCLTV